MEGLHEINQENNIEKIKTLKENLREIFDSPKYSTFGHGTTREKAENILINGIESSTSALDETAIRLEDNDESYNKILNWKHRNSKFIIIIMIPNPTDNLGYTYFDNVFDELPENRKSNTSYYGRGFGREYYIKPQFIKGYVDVNSLSFVKNELYDPEKKLIVKETPQIFPGRREYLRSSGLSEEDINKLMKPQENNSDDDWV